MDINSVSFRNFLFISGNGLGPSVCPLERGLLGGNCTNKADIWVEHLETLRKVEN